MEDSEAVGVATALERTCALEGKLRNAIQNSHFVVDSFGSAGDLAAVDREREALMAVSEQLELLEEKLREYSALERWRHEDRTIALSQLDSLRRELITTTKDRAAAVVFGKEVMKEVLLFADPNGNASSSPNGSPGSPLRVSDSNIPAHVGSPSSHFRSKLLLGSPIFGNSSRYNSISRSSENFSELGASLSPQQVRKKLWQASDSTETLRATVVDGERFMYGAAKAEVVHKGQAVLGPPLSPTGIQDKALYRMTNGSSRYPHDPSYGGKVNMKNYVTHKDGSDTLSGGSSHEPARVKDGYEENRDTRSTYAGSDDESCISGCTWSASRRGGSIAGRVRANGRPAGRQPRRKAGWLVASGGAAIRIVVAGLIAAIAVKGAVSGAAWMHSDERKERNQQRAAQRQAEAEAAEQQAPAESSAKASAKALAKGPAAVTAAPPPSRSLPAREVVTVEEPVQNSSKLQLPTNIFPLLPPPNVGRGRG